MYPEAKIHLYSDTEGNTHQSDFLKLAFPNFYDSITVIPNRKDKQHKIKSQFGEEVYPAALNNLPDEYLEKFKAADIFYDLHIDGLKWMTYDFDWQRFYHYFPRPKITEVLPIADPKDFVLLHLFSRPDSGYNLENWYIKALVEKLAAKIKVVIITENKYLELFKDIQGDVDFYTGGLNGCLWLSNHCKAFAGIDSGIKYLPISCSRPTLIFSKDCSSYQNVSHSHLLRWLIFKDKIIPMHLDYNLVTRMILDMIANPVCSLYPYISAEQADQVVVNRNIHNGL